IDPSTTELTDDKIDSDSSKNPANELIVSTEKPVEQKVDVGEPIVPSTTELTDDKIDSDSSKNPANELIVSTEKPVEQKVDVGEPIVEVSESFTSVISDSEYHSLMSPSPERHPPNVSLPHDSERCHTPP
ncbi:hypothetical protein ADUPG1_005246, partial [Aduncisulcus paluster]